MDSVDTGAPKLGPDSPSRSEVELRSQLNDASASNCVCRAEAKPAAPAAFGGGQIRNQASRIKDRARIDPTPLSLIQSVEAFTARGA